MTTAATTPTYYTTGDIARRLRIPRAVVCYAIDRAMIEPESRAGIVRLFGADQWPHIMAAIRDVRPRVAEQREAAP